MSSTRTPKSLALEEVLASRQDPQTKIKNKIVPAVATIAGSATAVPPYVLSREVVKNRIGEVFSLDGPRLDAIREVIDNSAIDQRYSVFPADYTIEPRPLSQDQCGVSGKVDRAGPAGGRARTGASRHDPH